MGLLLTFVASLVMWIVVWSFGFKSLDAMLLVVLIMVIAAALHIVAPHLPGKRPSS